MSKGKVLWVALGFHVAPKSEKRPTAALREVGHLTPHSPTTE